MKFIYLLFMPYCIFQLRMSFAKSVEKFIFIYGSGVEACLNTSKCCKLLQDRHLQGAQIAYSWEKLETKKSMYNFDSIKGNLISLNKKLFIQLQDKFFTPDARNLPDYIFTEFKHKSGLMQQWYDADVNESETGWFTMQWNDKIRERYQKMIYALLEELNGKIWGINLPKTSSDFNIKSVTKNVII